MADADDTAVATGDALPDPVRLGPGDVREIPLDDIQEVTNIRPEISDEGLEDLVASLRVQGQLEPALVRPAPDGAFHDRPYELVYGYRRKRAAGMVGLTHLRCEVREIDNDRFLDVMVTENLQRENLTAATEARVMKAMLDMGLSQAEVARRLGKHPSHVSHRLTLLNLQPDVLAKIDRGELSASHGEAIAALPKDMQEKFADRVVRDEVPVSRLTGWVKQVKDEEEMQEPPPAPQALQPVVASDAVELPALVLRDDLKAADLARMVLYALLRSGQDQEMLEFLEERHNAPYERLWDYIRGLSDDEVRALAERQARRYVEAAHRFASLEPTLVAELGDPDRTPPHDPLPLPPPPAPAGDGFPGLEEAGDWADDVVPPPAA